MSNAILEIPSTHAVICPLGFVAAGASCGIKPSGADDLALFLASGSHGAHIAAMFTRNVVKAAPVVLSQSNIAASSGRMRALIINSGCANAATGERGLHAARAVMNALASHLRCDLAEVLMNSTGVIGEHLNYQCIIDALPGLIASTREDGLHRAAKAIHTTDTRLKMAQQIVKHQGRSCRVVGVAKGAGMIHPNMATTIGVIMTDAEAPTDTLKTMLRIAVDRSFHRITVDGDTSTNDSVFLMASGEAGAFPQHLLQNAVTHVARELAEMVVRDGEGARKLIRVQVAGASTASDALLLAQTVASSLLVRTSVAGGDPNWGRVLAAAGRSGVAIDPQIIELQVNGLAMFVNGAPADTPKHALEDAYSCDEVSLMIHLHQGGHSEEYLTCDLTEGYVRINADYTS